VQNDEATPRAKDILMNFEEGMRFCLKEFGVRPQVGWQLDPFGFSSATPEILKAVGINRLVINRIPEAHKEVMRKNQDLEFVWQGDGEEEIYVHTLHGMYGIDYNFKMDQRWYAP